MGLSAYRQRKTPGLFSQNWLQSALREDCGRVSEAMKMIWKMGPLYRAELEPLHGVLYVKQGEPAGSEKP